MSTHEDHQRPRDPSSLWHTDNQGNRQNHAPKPHADIPAPHGPLNASPDDADASRTPSLKQLTDLFGPYVDTPAKHPVHDAPSPIKAASRAPKRNDKKQIDDALKQTSALLDPTAKHVDPQKDAIAATKTLTGLTPSQQQQAIQKMSSADFHRLLTTVPKEDRVAFESLYKNCKDPEKKLLLWAEFHKSKVASDAKAQKEHVPFLEGIGDALGFHSDTKRRNADRDEIAATTEKEVDEETQHMLHLLHSKKGKVSAADVERLASRKALESKIELKHLVNLTNDVDNPGTPHADTSMPTERVTWSKAELEQVASGLDRLPPDATTNNPLLKEIRRSKVRQDFNSTTNAWDKDPDVGGDHGSGVIRIFDSGVKERYRHTGQTSELGDHHKGQKTPHGPISPLEETIVHEVGHDVDDLNKTASDKFRAVTGWKQDAPDRATLKAKLQAAGLSPADADAKINQLELERANNYGGEGITVKGTTYKIDQYDRNNTGYTSHKEGAVPKGDPNRKDDEWDYARTNSSEHFAELYSKAVHVPERLHRDLIDRPKQEIQTKHAEELRLQARLAKLRAGKATPQQITAVEGQLKQTQESLAKAQQQQTMLQEEWHIMREDVFHTTDQKVNDSAAHLIANVPPEKQKKALKLQNEFKKKAESLMTPLQLQELEEEFQKRVHSL